MSQALVVEITNSKNEVLANAYYKWYANTIATMITISEILCAYEKLNNTNIPSILKAIKLLESTSARLSKEEIENANKINGIKDNYIIDDKANANDGLISITKERMDENMNLVVGYATINIDEEVVNFNVIHMDNLEEFYENNAEEIHSGYLKIDQIAYSDIKLSDIPFNEFEKTKKYLLNNEDEYFKISNEPNTIYYNMVG